MNNEPIVAELKRFGLNLYERQAYDALLRGGALSAHLIAKKSGVPSGKIYPVLEALISKKFISSHNGRPRMFVAVSPEVVFRSVISEKKKEVTVLENHAQQLAAMYTVLKPTKPVKEEELVETYFGHATAFSRSIILHSQSKMYWKTISRLTLQKEHLDACSAAVLRGVKILALTSVQETTPERVREWRKRGIEVRFLSEIPFRVSVYDDCGVIFRFSHEQSKRYVATHIRNTKLACGMSAFFDSLWGGATKE